MPELPFDPQKLASALQRYAPFQLGDAIRPIIKVPRIMEQFGVRQIQRPVKHKLYLKDSVVGHIQHGVLVQPRRQYRGYCDLTLDARIGQEPHPFGPCRIELLSESFANHTQPDRFLRDHGASEDLWYTLPTTQFLSDTYLATHLPEVIPARLTSDSL